MADAAPDPGSAQACSVSPHRSRYRARRRSAKGDPAPAFAYLSGADASTACRHAWPCVDQPARRYGRRRGGPGRAGRTTEPHRLRRPRRPSHRRGKDRCNQRFGQEALKGPKFIDPIPEEKRAYYDAIQAAYQASHDPQHPFFKDANGNIQPWGKGPGVACGMKFGGPPQPPDHRSLTDKIKATGLLGFDLGPLKCGIVIPQGSMTPEIGIATPK